MRCPNCDFEVPFELRYCGNCGAALKRVCPNCEYANPVDYNFCGMCGLRLADLSRAPLPEAVAGTPEPGLAPSDVSKPPPVSLAVAAVDTQPPVVSLEGERRVATIILADVWRSTDLLEQVGSETWVDVMNHVFHILETEIYRFGGVVDQFRGDGLVAFFGATAAHEDDPERAILAALAMQQGVKQYATTLAEQREMDLRLRVGVNTGEVIVTNVGDRSHYSEDTAMGEAIAMAARMETAAEPGTVLVSENTYHLVQTQFEWEPLGKIKVKGVSKPVFVYRPLAPRSDAEHLPVYGLSVPLIGRDEAFEVLKDCVATLYAGRGGIALLTGEKGIGKSFLMTEVRHYFARQGALLSRIAEGAPDGAFAQPSPPLQWLRGRCRSYGQSWPYSVWSDLLHNWLGRRYGEPPEETCERLRLYAEQLWGQDLMERHYPYIASFLSLPVAPSLSAQLENLGAEAWRQRFFAAMRSWLETLARQGPLVVSLADMHWADTASLDLLEFCLSICDNEALLWLVVFRPDRTQPIWHFQHYVETQYPHRMTQLTLSPLTEAQSHELVAGLIGADVLPEETEALVVEKAEGNPYFIQELIHALIADDVLEQEPQTGRWHAVRAVTSLDLPDSLQTLLLARIDRLPPEAKRILQMAAVIGTVFWPNILRALIGKDEDLKTNLTVLQRTQLVRERGRVPELGMEYVFRSSLIREAAYEGLLSAQRAAYHAKVAEYFESLPDIEERVEFYSVLAHHYHCANQLDKEVTYLLKAAEQARQIYANAEALEHYNRVLDLLDKLMTPETSEEALYTLRAQRFQALDGRRALHFLLGDFEVGWKDAKALLPLGRQLGEDSPWLVDALLQQPGVAYWRNEEELLAGVPLAEEALALARRLGDRHREMLCLGHIAAQRYNLSDITWMQTGESSLVKQYDPLSDVSWVEIGERALELARELDDQRYELNLLTAMGGVYVSSDPERSTEYLEMALPICQELGDPQAELDLLEVIGRQLESSGDYYRRLRECHEKTLRISREIGNRPAESQALLYCGQIRALYLGDYATGLAMLEEGRDIIYDTPGELYHVLRIAQIHIEQARYTEAERHLKRATELVSQRTYVLGRIGLKLVKMLFYNAQANKRNLRKSLTFRDEVHRLISEDNIQFAEQYRMVLHCETAVTYLSLAQLVSTQDERRDHQAQALAASKVALSLYEASGFVRPIECTSEKILFYYSKALAANGWQGEATVYLRRAYEEMTHKYALIPIESHFRRTYLSNIPLHRAIRAAYLASAPERPSEEKTAGLENATPASAQKSFFLSSFLQRGEREDGF